MILLVRLKKGIFVQTHDKLKGKPMYTVSMGHLE